MICPLTGYIGEFLGIDPEKWLQTVVGEVSAHTSRPIIIKPKGEGDLDEALRDAWCIVTYSSNAAVDAILAGVPAVVLGQSAVRPVAWSLDNIENPAWPERELWLRALAHHQFTLDEMRSGYAWEQVR